MVPGGIDEIYPTFPYTPSPAGKPGLRVVELASDVGE